MSFTFGLLAFPDVQQLDLTAPYEIFASVPGATVHLVWKDREPLRSARACGSSRAWISRVVRSSTCFAYPVAPA